VAHVEVGMRLRPQARPGGITAAQAWTSTADADAPWVRLAVPGQKNPATAPMSWRPVVIEILIAALVVFALVSTAGVLAAYRVAEQEAVTNALRSCDLLARSVLEPALSDALVPPEFGSNDSTASAAALSRVDHAVHAFVLSSTVVRVKIWTPAGRVVYSDEKRLIGDSFPLDETGEQALFTDSTIGAVSDLGDPENEFERSDGTLLEVYRPVHTPSGQTLLFETYSRYDSVIAHSGQMWFDIAAIAVGSLLLMHVLWVPLSWVLMNRLRQARRQRDMLLDRALSASHEERRRIAGTLHDGVVQELAATSFVVAGSAQQAQRAEQHQLAAKLETASAGVRASISALRSLLVDIYPPNLRVAGLSATLADLATSLRSRGLHVTVESDPDLELDARTQTLIYRVAQECLRNADRHAQAREATVRISRRDGRIRLDVTDNGIGFDVESTLEGPDEGHFGLQVMRDLAVEHKALLAVRSRPGVGTRWLLEVAPDAG
jgi:signal transduction histidine kinase